MFSLFILSNSAFAANFDAPPDEISRVLQYAKAGKGSAARPDNIVTPTPRWYGFVELKDCALYWNVNSIIAWTQDNPTNVEMLVKFVWNNDGLEQHKTYLKAQQPYCAGFDGLSYTLVNYQFLVTENKVRILSEADHNIAEGSKEDQAKKIALNWIHDRESNGDK